MTALAIATGYDSPRKRDASCVFLPESRAFCDLHPRADLPYCTRLVIEHPVSARIRRRQVEATIRDFTDLDTLAVFGHGTPAKLIATGHTMGTVEGLVDAIRAASGEPDLCAPDLDVIFYACLTARGKRGFADYVADRIPWAHVWAHSTAGHAAWNPYVELSGGPNGGDPVFTIRDGLRWAHWRDRLREDQEYRLTFWHAGRALNRAQAIEAVRESAGR